MVDQIIKDKFFSELLDKLSFILDDSKNKFSLIPLKSKKNMVYELILTDRLTNSSEIFIIKKLQSEKADKEYEMINYLKAQKLQIPKIIYFKNPYIIQEKVNGENLCDFINNNLRGKKELSEVDNKITKKILLAIKLLAKWLADLHKKNIILKEDFDKIIVINKGDTRLKDFIINFSNKKIYGVDFEESYEGNYLEDIAWICCSLIDTDPGIFEMEEPLHKIELINLFLKEYFKINADFKFSFNYFAKSLIENLNLVINRRELKIGELNENSVLNKILKKI